MWPNYNTTEAVLRLNSFIAKVSQENADEVPLSELELSQYTVAQVANTQAYKIVSRAAHDEELVVKVLGLVCSKTLPPFRGTLDNTSAVQRRKLRQHVKLCGGGATAFDDYELKINSILDFFGASVGRGTIEASEVGVFNGHYAVDFHTRYFEERKYALGVTHLPFDAEIDPTGILERSRGTDLVHGEQNIVEYCIKSYDEGGEPRYEAQSPIEFAVGDIVEICATFTLFPFRMDGNPAIRFRLVNGLRTLSLLNHDYAKAMRQAAVTRTEQRRQIKVATPKRKYLTNKRKGDEGGAKGVMDEDM